jgi:membrane-bound ClpP family serine protease
MSATTLRVIGVVILLIIFYFIGELDITGIPVILAVLGFVIFYELVVVKNLAEK